MGKATMIALMLAFALGCSAALTVTRAAELAVRTDRPEAVFAVYNSLRGPKQLVLDPLSSHSGKKPNWSRESRAFLLGQRGR